LFDLQALADAEGAHPMPVLCRLRGFHVLNTFEDTLHDDLIGVRLDVLGSSLLELSREGAFGPPPPTGSWKIKLNAQLSTAHLQFNSWLALRGEECSQAEFSHLNLSMTTLDCWPTLKSKAKNAAFITAWLSEVAKGFVSDEFTEVRSACLDAFAKIWTLTNESKYPNWQLTDEQCEALETLRQMALLSLHWLSKHCNSHDVFRWKIRPKYHRMDHGLRRAVRTKISPSVYYTFSPEDFMGLVARMCGKCHGSTIIRRGVCRWLLSWFVEMSEVEGTLLPIASYIELMGSLA